MPLKKGRSRKVQSANIKEMVDKFDQSGRIGTSKPKSRKAAIRQAVAISYRQKKASGKKRK